MVKFTFSFIILLSSVLVSAAVIPFAGLKREDISHEARHVRPEYGAMSDEKRNVRPDYGAMSNDPRDITLGVVERRANDWPKSDV